MLFDFAEKNASRKGVFWERSASTMTKAAKMLLWTVGDSVHVMISKEKGG